MESSSDTHMLWVFHSARVVAFTRALLPGFAAPNASSPLSSRAHRGALRTGGGSRARRLWHTLARAACSEGTGSSATGWGGR